MNPYGYFPLHKAAEMFSVDMVKLLFKYGASANTRTAGAKIVENLLPLHFAVENSCLHKYLEDNLSHNQDHQDYIYKLIQLLCLPEMKIFLDTTRLLAKKTNNLLDELWSYAKDGKLVQTAILLLACQGQIRGVSASKKRNGIPKQDGFDAIMTSIMKHSNQLEACSTLDNIAMLVDVISQAGEALDSYIQTHSGVVHVEVLQQVASIIKDYGFFSNGEGIDGVENKVARSFYLDLEYTRNSFFPYWRSVLLSHVDVKIYPAYAKADPKCRLNLNKQHHSLADKGSPSTIANHTSYHTCSRLFCTAAMRRIPQVTSNNTCSRLFGTIAMKRIPQVTSNNHTSKRMFGSVALTLLKIFEYA
ncbi:hypothetical protein BS78_04G158800 [Paspalum vaginatum]|nr:hypothetical protein BS78_04G158800 [Paspalum vaginatum]